MKKFLKAAYIIPSVLLIVVIIIFGGWFVMPKRSLDIALLDKTVPANLAVKCYKCSYGFARLSLRHFGGNIAMIERSMLVGQLGIFGIPRFYW